MTAKPLTQNQIDVLEVTLDESDELLARAIATIRQLQQRIQKEERTCGAGHTSYVGLWLCPHKEHGGR